MPWFHVFVSDADSDLLPERAAQLGINPPILAENIIRWYLHGMEPPIHQRVSGADFRAAMEQTFAKNAELYRRLAKND